VARCNFRRGTGEGIAVNEAAKKTVLRHFPYGLYVVTVMSEGEDHGMTANWLTQASFEPPMIVVALENDAKTLTMIRDSRAFAVNVLKSDQRALAARLGRSSQKIPHKLADIAHRPAPALGSPILRDGVLGWVECRLVTTMAAGDHTLALGEVIEAGVEAEGSPLTLGESGMKYAG
jgi:flavin reductase (DIM6/NTAB) family NADH-FMN oxidoreductase RutF